MAGIACQRAGLGRDRPDFCGGALAQLGERFARRQQKGLSAQKIAHGERLDAAGRHERKVQQILRHLRIELVGAVHRAVG